MSLGTSEDVNKAIEAAQKSLPVMEAYRHISTRQFSSIALPNSVCAWRNSLISGPRGWEADYRREGEVGRLIDTFKIAAERQ